MLCKECGKDVGYKSYAGMCQGCYKYFKNGGTINPIPEHGRIEYDINGKIICHICGRAYSRLGSHIKESHNMTTAEYKKQFGLCARTKTTTEDYSAVMKMHANKHKMGERLMKAGENTRFKKGDNTARKNKPVRLQEVLEKRDRKYKKSC